MRKKYVLCVATVVCLILGGIAFAQMHDDVMAHKQCRLCGMDRGMFNFSRVLITYDDGSISALCSLHCAAVDIANSLDKSPKSIQVADFKGKDLIDAEKAVWAIGGQKPGVMTKTGKWAFAKKDDAESFIKQNQGRLGSFDDAMRLAYEDMYADTKMIQEKRKAKRMKMSMDDHHHHGN
jgi:nitrous oxide reductase accessory protein NosL